MIHRTVHEWGRISYGTGETELPTAHADRLAKEARASVFSGSSGDGVLEHGRTGLRARGIVGVIATLGSQLEILPKIERSGECSDILGTAKLRHRLIHMLAETRKIRVEPGNIAEMAWQRDTILELLIRLFCAKLIDAVRQGMPQLYAGHEEDIPFLRGRLDVTRQFSILAGSPHKLACHFDARTSDIALNQVMRAVIDRLSRLVQAPDNQRSLRELSFAYADISDVPTAALRWDLIVLDRTSTRWRELLSLARLFLDDRHQQTSSGRTDGFALLFEMNVLFEEYVGCLLSHSLAGTGLRVAAQAGHRDCLYVGEAGRFRTQPDLIVRQGKRIVAVIDTKWKRINGPDDPKRGVDQADVYQAMAYSQLYDCVHVMLLYPHHADLPCDATILQRYAIARPGARKGLFVATLDVTASRKCQLVALRQLIENLQC